MASEFASPSPFQIYAKQAEHKCHQQPVAAFGECKDHALLWASVLTLLKSLVYYFIRCLIHRPAVCFANEHLRSPSVLALSDSAKDIIQILQLLNKQRLCLSITINRRELVFIAGLGLLWQTLGLKRDSKLAKKSQKLLVKVLQQLEPESSTATAEFGVFFNDLVSFDDENPTKQPQEMGAPTYKPSKSSKKELQFLKSRLTPDARLGQPKENTASRRNNIPGATYPVAPQNLQSSGWASLPPAQLDQLETPQYFDKTNALLDLASDPQLASIEYENPRTSCATPSVSANGATTMADWEYVLSDMERGYSNISTGTYGGKDCGGDPGPFASIAAEYNQKLQEEILGLPPKIGAMHGLSPETWSARSGEIPPNQEKPTQSVLSYSGENLGSICDRASFADIQVHHNDMNLMDPFHGLAILTDEEMDGYSLVNG
jgi:hypothetical protein